MMPSSSVDLSRPKRRAATDASRLKQDAAEAPAKKQKVAPISISAEPQHAAMFDPMVLSVFASDYVEAAHAAQEAAVPMAPPNKPNKPGRAMKQSKKAFRCPGGDGCGKSAGECVKGYTTEGALAQHQQPVEEVPAPNESGRYQCKEPGCEDLSCSTPANYRVHARRHLYPPILFKCSEEECGKSFMTPRWLDEHRLWHMQPDSFKCSEEECGKSFKTRASLDEHRLWHSQPDLFKCSEEECGKSFSTRQYVEEHGAGHRGEYECDDCAHPCFMSKLGLSLHSQFCGEETSGHCCEWPGGCKVTFLVPGIKNPTLNGMRLCALHSRTQYRDADQEWPGAANSHYCTACTTAGRPPKYASFYGVPNEEGVALPNQLCAPCAVKAGTKSSWCAGASHECDDVLHVLIAQMQQQEGRGTWVLCEHVHFEPGQDPDGAELRPFRERPLISVDGIIRDSADGGEIVALIQHQGNRYHGFPPQHPEHETFVVNHTYGPVKYNHTMERTAQYRCNQLHDGATAIPDNVVVIETWGNDYTDYKRALKTNPSAQLKFLEYTRRPGELDEVLAEMQVDASGAPTTDSSGHGHTTREERENLELPPGCALCRETRLAKRAAASTATSTSTATTSTATDA